MAGKIESVKRVIRRTNFGLAYFKVTDTSTPGKPGEVNIVSHTEAQYGAFVAGGGVDTEGFVDLTEMQIAELRIRGECEL